MADISPDEVRKVVEVGGVVTGAIGGFLAAVATIFWRFHSVVKRFEALESAEAARKAQDERLNTLLELLSKAQLETEGRLKMIEQKLPAGELMPASGVWEVFGKQEDKLGQVEKSIRSDMALQHNSLRNELTDRMDDIKTDLRQVNDNIIKLVTRISNKGAE